MQHFLSLSLSRMSRTPQCYEGYIELWIKILLFLKKIIKIIYI